MLKKPLQRITANSFVYDRIQWLAGVNRLYAQIGSHIGLPDHEAVVLDIGGGTGISKTLLDLPPKYFCLDNDMGKLAGFVAKHNSHKVLLGDGSQLPFGSRAVDLILCVNVAHHLADHILAGLFHESIRVLKDTGRFIFVDPVWDPKRRIGKLIWRYDRGDYPRTPEILRSFIMDEISVEYWETTSIYHRYIVGLLTKRQSRKLPISPG